jgi:hypothetical protein
MLQNGMGESSGDGLAQNPENTTKLEAILRVFASGKSLNRFEAEHHHDHCLHSTVSGIEKCYGVVFDRRWETIPCLRGRATVRCKRYWLRPTPENIAMVQALLKMWRHE